MIHTTQSINPVQNINPVQTIFGPGYVPEQHADQTHFADDGEARFAEFVKSLRSLLWTDNGAARH